MSPMRGVRIPSPVGEGVAMHLPACRVAIVGAGNMGGAMVARLCELGVVGGGVRH
ncbi:hypothetical protein Y695_03036 [Hydrogenophaga sp. T4]|nr:hypothetical protein Y695_03036 [Hydrogenophaga sp. T4]